MHGAWRKCNGAAMMFGKKRRAITRLLIVEDEPLVAFDNEHFLSECGYDIVATVDSVEDAIDAIEAEEIDLVLADVALSDGGSGVDVARAAKAKGVGVLFVTGNCPIEAREFAIGCLAKPYVQRDLRTAIEAIERTLGGDPPKKLPAGLSLYVEVKG